ncbi:MAG: hypothetical protein U0232_06190 [Thermomicrobiales bacterium]
MTEQTRSATVSRQTGETQVDLTLTIDGQGEAAIATGVGALDHFLTLFARHGLFDLAVAAQGDPHRRTSHRRRRRHLPRPGPRPRPR